MKTEKNAQINSGENQIVVYQPDETIRLDVRLENETVWLTQEQMSKLFGRTQPVIARHIGNIFTEGELDREVVYAKFAYTTRHGAIDGKTQTKEVGLYNLDVVISVGYRVKSIQGTRFRQWATKVLKEFMLRGYAFNQRLNQLEDRIDRECVGRDKRGPLATGETPVAPVSRQDGGSPYECKIGLTAPGFGRNYRRAEGGVPRKIAA